jgi:asparagine synthase (glutamine-hydrolysing)
VCGIAGVYALGERPPDPAWGPLLVQALRHRGPDGQGVYCDRRVVFAHTRLAIIDLSETGRQPMDSGDGRYLIVQNGEIYNHESLRGELEREGARFRGRSDTETLVELLARRGRAGLARVRGMFAFAWYDRASGDLLLARDRLGKKPVFWIRTAEYFAFASEARALLALPFVPRRLRRDAAADYLRWLYVPSPRTALEGVCRLEPATTLTLAGASPGEAPRLERYWRLPPPDPATRADPAWFEALDGELLDAVKLRTVSDVPIGVFLSGGVDSNLVLEMLHRAGHRPIRTFTVGFRGLPDERAIARQGAWRHSDEHVELAIEPGAERDIGSALSCFGEPLGDSAIVTTWLIAREASQHVKVVLNGDGGDELFGGYARYPYACRADLARRVPGALALLERRERARPTSMATLAAVRAGHFGAAARALEAVTGEARLESMLRPDLLAGTNPSAADAAGAASLAEAVFAWDTRVYLPDDLLLKVDTAAMAHALENRSPLLDPQLFERLARLPAARRVHPLRTKPLLRRLARGRVPEAALSAPKQGFQLPIESWLAGPLCPWLDEYVLRAEVTRPLYRDGALARELAAFRDGRGDELAPYRLWAIAALEFWARAFAIEVDA